MNDPEDSGYSSTVRTYHGESSAAPAHVPTDILSASEVARLRAVRERLSRDVELQRAAVPERWYFAKWLVRTGRLTEEC